MLGRIFSIILLAVALCSSATAGERIKLGHGRLVVNDFLGDNYDRWRTGSVASSHVMGSGWNGQLPEAFGEIIEFRFLGEIIAPENLTTPSVGDRPYAGALSMGMHTHFQRAGFDFSLGGDLTAVGPQTGLGDFQTAVHDVLGVTAPSATTLGSQIANKFYASGTVEVARSFAVGQATTVRPFVEARAGLETYVRAGVDVTIGHIGQGELLVRDTVSGHRYRTVQQNVPGYSVVLGADIAKVDSSAYLPGGLGYVLTDTRDRVRAGVHWQGEKSSVFYGVSWLGEEFVGQSDSQVVGAIRLNLQF